MNTLRKNKHVLTNALLFQVLWFVAILGEWYWALVPLALMLAHLLVIRKQLPLSILSLVLLSCIGIVFDSIFNYMGIYQFSVASPEIPYFGLPVWLASLWLGFCFTLPLSLVWLVKKAYLFVLACALMGPISYLAGRHLEALNFSDANILFLVAEWCVFSILALMFLQPRLRVSSVLPNSFKKESTC
tara:strand:- start:7116 stop:7676 length:561 start_codon:yes stop_codon:yes gene_type:complete